MHSGSDGTDVWAAAEDFVFVLNKRRIMGRLAGSGWRMLGTGVFW